MLFNAWRLFGRIRPPEYTDFISVPFAKESIAGRVAALGSCILLSDAHSCENSPSPDHYTKSTRRNMICYPVVDCYDNRVAVIEVHFTRLDFTDNTLDVSVPDFAASLGLI